MRRRRILVLTSHGILTNAPWQNRLEALVKTEAQKRASLPGARAEIVTVLHNNYLYFSLFEFMNPLRRRDETRKFEAKLRALIKDNEYDEIHLVGHSFGTHIIAHSLKNIGEDLKRRIGTVILAGSVLHRSFPWDGLVGTQIKRLVNDCGDRDTVLVLNALLPLGSGLAGRRGFAGIMGSHFRNRYFSFGHSGYFEANAPGISEDDFMQERWIPLLFGAPIQDVNERSNSFLAGIKGWAIDQCQNMKWLIPVGVLASLCFLLLYWALVVRTNFNLETLRDAAAITDAVKRQNAEEAHAIIAKRENAIVVRVESVATTFESLFRSGVISSLYPPQFEAARLTTTFADRPIRRIDDLQPIEVLFRGTNTIEIHSLRNEEFLAEPGNVRVDRYRLDTLQPDDHPMWAWKGLLASTAASPEPDEQGFPANSDGSRAIPPDYIATRNRFTPLTGTGLQDTLERQFSIALDGRELSVWDTFEQKRLSNWNAALWAQKPIIDAHPCGVEGKATIVAKDGVGYIFSSTDRVSALSMPAGTKLAYLLGNANCEAFAGVSDNGRLLIWSAPDAAPTSLNDARRRVRSFEFSKRDPALLLVNTALAGTDEEDRRVLAISISKDNLSISEVEHMSEASSAVFSPSADMIVLELVGDTERRTQCRIVDAPGSRRPNPIERPSFPCLGASALTSAQVLSEQIAFIENEEGYVSTDAGPEGFGYASTLVVRRTASNATDWRVIASRSDVVSLDATSDGSLMVTVAGDAADEGIGADWSVRIWSRYHSQPLYERKQADALPVRAWLAHEGSQVAILWRRWNSERTGLQSSLELVHTTADFGQGSGAPAKSWPVWGIRRSEAYEDARRPCKSVPEREVPDHPGVQSSYPNPLTGCWMRRDGFLSARRGGRDILLRFRQDEGTSQWNIRALAGTKEEQIQISDGAPIADDIVDFTSDAAEHRIFAAHSDGSVTRLDFKPDLKATTIYRNPSMKASPLRSIEWHAQTERLGLEFARTTDVGIGALDRTIIGLTDDGRVMSTARSPTELLQGEGAGGVFGPHDEYWSVSRVEVSRRDVAIAENETETEILYHWFLQNWVTGKRIPLSCNGEPFEVTSNTLAYEPDLLVSWSRRYVAAARLGPSMGAFGADSSADVFDLTEGVCIGHVEHGDEILQMAVSDDGRLLVTGGKSEAYAWHVPTQVSVGTIYGPVSISSGRAGLGVVSRIASDKPVEITLPSDLRTFLGIGTITVP